MNYWSQQNNMIRERERERDRERETETERETINITVYHKQNICKQTVTHMTTITNLKCL
jgi:hypothetical protein